MSALIKDDLCILSCDQGSVLAEQRLCDSVKRPLSVVVGVNRSLLGAVQVLIVVNRVDEQASVGDEMRSTRVSIVAVLAEAILHIDCEWALQVTLKPTSGRTDRQVAVVVDVEVGVGT